ncbi:MAG: acetyl-CoA carboxylase biotin carboxylase subunit [Planctomycetes bacterium]|jgi:acetyl-CoA carboxylase biotin carboxylase subunit|nr:acetyl-CoA carboxylase biotin carboxylase subunit [Planctomycetota bacterium]MBT4028768.1 acetyl-CoA carboxylase biotin carboxylase subunit [Planctomycetota bacterium]MBT4560212.1 acetyl-CoA carboxylase biotin carboxylase subunit [Planctomycetota bacterium]MBT5101832.1 acetyl-CoA carboxylase biotin carboxylase subunit [Planctomycetota bacterium]MBT7318223.1 acetyl-CoA carboxylase biotin carboxylase subunit [Planctomycetota bacterium]
MFHRVFIANRGEVAARMVRACQDLGIEAVCAASEADLAAGYPYLKEAAEVVCLGPGPANQSYLKALEVIQAAKQTQCSAIHPGWGFLAENAEFASLCKQHGLTFIGPSPETIDRMGRKVSARASAIEAGLPIVPGSKGLLPNAEAAKIVAQEVGYPVVLKADAGGGGRGIRRCDSADEIDAAFTEAAREAETAFGCAELYLEKYLLGGRHIEFQVMGDGRGKAIHFGERECSIQRRHQKLLEEAPSSILTAEQRAHYGELSTRAAAFWNYSGAGTMEYLLADDGKLYFLEMNTRLQVEHPVTEVICGVDLAQLQIRIAAGEDLPFTQEEITLTGHAIEARINAEDPDADFRPAPGTVERFVAPTQGRTDTHLVQGAKIPPHYDSLIAKVIVHADTRESAIASTIEALNEMVVEGVPTTTPLHLRILAEPDFQQGNYDTLWLEKILKG